MTTNLMRYIRPHQRLSPLQQCTTSAVPRSLLRRTASSFRFRHPDFPAIDAKWQRIWERQEQQQHETASSPAPPPKKPKYVLPMFPYPSGSLHMGHIRVYTISDVISRYQKMKGEHVVHPIGWDAFGLPAENAAIERGVDPAEWTVRNIEQMKGQLKAMNGSWDWDRELRTCDPAYYKHTQRLFLKLYHAGLAYQKEAFVNWDPIDHTVLANEQVDAAGNSWRSGAKVEQRMLKQWFLATTHFAQELYEDLSKLGESGSWPARVVDMQKNWLGKSTGVQFPFDLEIIYSRNEGARKVLSSFSQLDVFTTRLDTLFGAQFLALSLEHPLVQAYAEHDPSLQEFVASAVELPSDSKAGYLLPFTARNKLLGVNRVSIYAAPYVLDGYGTGAVMGVPAHDSRDYAFWREHRKDEAVKFAIRPENDKNHFNQEQPFTEQGVALHLGTPWDGQSSVQASAVILQHLQSSGYKASAHTKWRLRDWLISRQRYWGAPIPIVYCSSCGTVPVSLESLPVELPKLSSDQFQGKGGNPLDSSEDWVNTKCPQCNGPARRDTDTMDTFMDSAWYFFRFADPHNKNEPAEATKVNELMPVDYYVGGVEHAILHLLYARFMAKFLASASGDRLWSASFAEPFSKLVTQGMVHGKTYTDPANGRFLKPDEVEHCGPEGPRIKATGALPHVSFEKMSKSKYNGVDPASCLAQYGADVTRAHMLFAAPEGEVLEWEVERIVGMTRWLAKVWRLVGAHPGRMNNQPNFDQFEPLSAAQSNLIQEVANTRKSVDEKLQNAGGLNTVVSDLMKLTNSIDKFSSLVQTEDLNSSDAMILVFSIQVLVRMMAPLTPAFSEECWQMLHSTSLVDLTEVSSQYTPLFNGSQTWPDMPELTKCRAGPHLHTFVVSINGKVKFASELSPERLPESNEETTQEWISRNVFTSKEATKWLSSGRNRKIFDRPKAIFHKKLGGNKWVVNVLTEPSKKI